MIAELSETSAWALRTCCGIPTAIPTGGLFRRSCIIASNSGPGSWKISPASRLGDIAASLPALENVASSKWLTEEPSSYFLGV